MQEFNPQAYFFKIDSTIKSIRLYIQKSLHKNGIELTIDQWVVLDKIYENQGLTQQMLSDLAFKDPSTVSRILNILEEKRILLRKPDTNDKRKFGIYLSPMGGELYQKANEIVVKARKEIWKDMDQSNFENLVHIMDKIYANANSSHLGDIFI